jgi:chloramphenicol O-acetyltransferase
MKNKKFIDYKSENNNKLIKKNDVIPGIKISYNDHKQNYVKMIENIKNKEADYNQRNNDNHKSNYQNLSLAQLSQDNFSSPKKLNEHKGGSKRDQTGN